MEAGRARDPSLLAEGGEGNGHELAAESPAPAGSPGYGPLSISRRGGAMIRDKWKPMYEFLAALPPSNDTLKAWQVQEWLDHCWQELPTELTDMGVQKITLYTINTFFRLRQKAAHGQRQAREERREFGRDDGDEEKGAGARGGAARTSRRGGSMIQGKWKPMYEWLESLPPSAETLKGWQVQEWLDSCWHELPKELTDMGAQRIILYTLNSFFRLRQRAMQMEARRAGPLAEAAAEGEGDGEEEAGKEPEVGMRGRPQRRRRRTREYWDMEDTEDEMGDAEDEDEDRALRTGRLHRGARVQEELPDAGRVVAGRHRRRRMPKEHQAQAEGEDLRWHLQRRENLSAAVDLFNRIQRTLPTSEDRDEVAGGETEMGVEMLAPVEQGAAAEGPGMVEQRVQICLPDGQPASKLWPSAALKEGLQPPSGAAHDATNIERSSDGHQEVAMQACHQSSEKRQKSLNNLQVVELASVDSGLDKGTQAELMESELVREQTEAKAKDNERTGSQCRETPAREANGPRSMSMEVDEDDGACHVIPLGKNLSSDGIVEVKDKGDLAEEAEAEVDKGEKKRKEMYREDEGEGEEHEQEHALEDEEPEGLGDSDESSKERLEEDERDAVGSGGGGMHEEAGRMNAQDLLRTRCVPPNASPVPWPLFFGALPEAQDPLPLLLPRGFPTHGRQSSVGPVPSLPPDQSQAGTSSAPNSQEDRQWMGSASAPVFVPEHHGASPVGEAAVHERRVQAEASEPAAEHAGSRQPEEPGATVHDGGATGGADATQQPNGNDVAAQGDVATGGVQMAGGAEPEASWIETQVVLQGPLLLAAPMGCSLASFTSIEPDRGNPHRGQIAAEASGAPLLVGASSEHSAAGGQSPTSLPHRSLNGPIPTGAEEVVLQGTSGGSTRGAKPSSCSVMPWLGRREITGLGPLSSRVCAPWPPSRAPGACSVVASRCQRAWGGPLGLDLGVRPASLMGWGWGLELRHEGPASSVLRRHYYSSWHPAWAFYTSHFAAAPVGRNAENVVAQKVLDVRFRPSAGVTRVESDSGAGTAAYADEGHGAGSGGSCAPADGNGTAGLGQEGPQPTEHTPEEMAAEAPTWGQLVCGCNEAPSELLALDLSTGAAVPLRGHECQIQAVEYACQGTAIVSCGANVVKVWDADSGNLRHTLGRLLTHSRHGSSSAPARADLGPGRGRGRGRGGQGRGRGATDRVDATEGTVLSSSGNAAPSSGPVFSTEGSAGQGSSGHPVAGHWDKISALAVNLWDSRFVASSSAALDPRVLLWDVENGSMKACLEMSPGGLGTGPPMDVLCFADAVRLVGGSDYVRGRGHSVLCVWDTREGRAQGCMEAHDSYVTSLAIDPTSGGSTLLSCGGDGSVALYDVRSMRQGSAMADSPSLLPSGGRCEATSVGFSFCGTYFHASFNANCTLVWDKRFVSSGASLPDQLPSTSRCCKPGVASLSRPLHLLSQGKPMPGVQHSAQHPGYVDFGDEGINDAKWFHRSPCLVTASGNGSVALWDVAAGQPLVAHFKAHSRAVNSVDISEDDNCIASGGDDQKVVLYLREEGRPLGSNVRSSRWRLTHSLAG